MPSGSGGAQAPRRRPPRKPRIRDRGRGLPGSRPQRENPRPRHLSGRELAFGAGEEVKGGVEARARRRLDKLDGVPGVNPKDGITGREARKVRRVWLRRDRKDQQNQQRPQRPKRDPFAEQVEAQTRLRYGGQVAELESERRASQQHQANLGGWYQQYQDTVAQAAREQQAFAAGLQQAQFNQANQAAAADQQSQQQLQQQQQQSADIRGTTVDPALAQTAQAGIAARQSAGMAGAGQLAGRGQAQAGYMQSRVGTAAGEGIVAREQEQARARKIDQLARELQADMGAFRTESRRQLVEDTHKRRLENAAFGLDQAKARADVLDDLADNRRMSAAERRQRRKDRFDRRDKRADNRRADRIEDRQQRAEERQQRNTDSLIRERESSGGAGSGGSGGGSGGDGKYTQSQKNSAQREFREARRLAGQIGAGRGERGDAIDFAVSEHDIDPLVARAAIAPDTLTRGQRRELARMGIRVDRPRGVIRRPPLAPGSGGGVRPT